MSGKGTTPQIIVRNPSGNDNLIIEDHSMTVQALLQLLPEEFAFDQNMIIDAFFTLPLSSSSEGKEVLGMTLGKDVPPQTTLRELERYADPTSNILMIGVYAQYPRYERVGRDAYYHVLLHDSARLSLEHYRLVVQALPRWFQHRWLFDDRERTDYEFLFPGTQIEWMDQCWEKLEHGATPLWVVRNHEDKARVLMEVVSSRYRKDDVKNLVFNTLVLAICRADWEAFANIVEWFPDSVVWDPRLYEMLMQKLRDDEKTIESERVWQAIRGMVPERTFGARLPEQFFYPDVQQGQSHGEAITEELRRLQQPVKWIWATVISLIWLAIVFACGYIITSYLMQNGADFIGVSIILSAALILLFAFVITQLALRRRPDWVLPVGILTVLAAVGGALAGWKDVFRLNKKPS